MYNLSKNKQVIYSLNTLSNSLFYLLLSKNLNDISITEICENSNITRKTFYRNCESIYDLVQYRIDTEINSALASADWDNPTVGTVVRGFFSYWSNKKAFLTTLYKNDMFAIFANRLAEMLNANPHYNEKVSHLSNSLDPVTKYYCDSFVTGGCVQLLFSWVSRDFDISADELTRIYMLFWIPHN